MERTHFGDFDNSKNRKHPIIKGEGKQVKTTVRIIEKNSEGVVNGTSKNIRDGGLKLKPVQQAIKTLPVIIDQR